MAKNEEVVATETEATDTKEASTKKSKECETCHGTGLVSPVQLCEDCKGSGRK